MVDSGLESAPTCEERKLILFTHLLRLRSQLERGGGYEGGQKQKHRKWSVKRQMLTVRFVMKKDSTNGKTISAAETCKSPKFNSMLTQSSPDYNLSFSVDLMTGKYSMVILTQLY